MYYTDRTGTQKSIDVPPGENRYVETGLDTGTLFSTCATGSPSLCAGDVFYALTVTDVNRNNGERGDSSRDWGHPLIPANQLT